MFDAPKRLHKTLRLDPTAIDGVSVGVALIIARERTPPDWGRGNRAYEMSIGRTEAATPTVASRPSGGL